MLSQINSPADLAALSHEDLIELSAEIRGLLIEKVSKTGGHLGPNLGVVELTVAIHRVFESAVREMNEWRLFGIGSGIGNPGMFIVRGRGCCS